MAMGHTLSYFLRAVTCCALLVGAVHAQMDRQVQYGEVTHTARTVSLVELLAGGNKFDGKVIRVTGVLRLEFEGNALYLSKEHYTHRIAENAVWISLDYSRLGTNRAVLSKLNGRYVLIEGVFWRNNKGHKGMFSGAVQNVSRVLLFDD
jgi:hypothetical protein